MQFQKKTCHLDAILVSMGKSFSLFQWILFGVSSEVLTLIFCCPACRVCGANERTVHTARSSMIIQYNAKMIFVFFQWTHPDYIEPSHASSSAVCAWRRWSRSTSAANEVGRQLGKSHVKRSKLKVGDVPLWKS